MAKSPSPLIPLILVVSLGLLLRGNSLSAVLSLPSASEAESVIFTFIVCIPVLLLLAIYSASYAIVFPLLVALVTYTVSTVLLGPLMLILIGYVGSGCLPAFKGNGEELGRAFLLVLGFFMLQWVLSDEGRQLGTLVLALVILLCYQFGS